MPRPFFLSLLTLLAVPACSGSTPPTVTTGADAGDGSVPVDAGLPIPETDAGTGDDAGPSTTTVRGRVLGYSGLPLLGFRVRIGNVDTTTDGEGRFVVEDAPATYDAVVTGPASWATIHVGLTTREPLLRSVIEPLLRSPARLAVQYPSSGPSTRASTIVAAESLPTLLLGDRETTRAQGTVGWGLGPAKDLDLLSFAYTWDAAKGIERFTGAARAALTVRHDESFDVQAAFSPVAERAVTVDARAAESQRLQTAALAVRLPAAPEWRLIGAPTAPAAPASEVLVPQVANADFAVGLVTVAAVDPSPNAPSTTTYVPIRGEEPVGPLELPAPPRFLSPAPNDTGFGPGSRIAWTGPGRGLCNVTIAPEGGFGPRWDVLTEGTAYTVPDLRSVGRALLPNTRHTVRVACKSTDEGGTFSAGQTEVRVVTTR